MKRNTHGVLLVGVFFFDLLVFGSLLLRICVYAYMYIIHTGYGYFVDEEWERFVLEM